MLRLGFLLLLITALTACGSKSEPEPFTVLVSAASLGMATGNATSSTSLAESIGSIVATADGQKCTSVDLVNAATKNADGDVIISIGEKGQPEPCRVGGTKVVFIQPRAAGQCSEFYWETTVRPGLTDTMINLAPKPPGSACVLP